jgi:alkyldihydroxyacetonephosphate synthase
VLPLRPPVRSAVGPALHQLFVGAEGGLGVILEAQLRVRRLPEATVGAGFLFKSVPDGLAAMREVMQHGLRPLVMRLYDPEDTAFQGVDQGGCLLVTAVAGERAIAAAEMQFLERIMVSAEQLGEAPWRHWLEHRFDLSDKQLRAFLQPPGSYVDTIEIAAPWSTLGIVYDEVKRRLSSDGFALCHFSHAYPHGCCAYFTFGGTASSDDEAVARYESRWRDAMEVAARHGATCSHHHGVGQLRSGWAVREMGEWRSVWHALRDALDPAHVLNPNAVGGR